MEEGYLARILVADGTEGIAVGKARCAESVQILLELACADAPPGYSLWR